MLPTCKSTKSGPYLKLVLNRARFSTVALIAFPLLKDIEAKLGKELPPDPIAFIITKLQALEKASKKVCAHSNDSLFIN